MINFRILLLIVIVNLFWGQEKTDSVAYYNKGVIRFAPLLMNSTFSLDFALAKNIITAHKFGVYYVFGYDGFSDKHFLLVNPLYEGHLRYFYNFNKRLSKGKSISKYSGNYLGVMFAPLIGSDIVQPTPYLALLRENRVITYWGIQRNIGKKEIFYFDVYTGIIYGWNPRVKTKVQSFLGYFGVWVSFNIGFNLYSFNLPIKRLLDK